ncbi:MAG TPA: DUF3303 family protein [Chloroflexota bacterium]|jgi:hypothetical protein|nr:DUF3303 family protein [Chloroflexota bacterium]
MAKYLVSWKTRQEGTAQQNHDGGKRLLDTFAKWQIPADQNFLQFLARIDGQGGCAVVETDNPAGLSDAPSKFGPWLEFEITPMVDIMDNIAVIADGAEFRESI